MKKLIFALFLGIAMILTFNSCKKYEESMYNKSNYKIQYVWYRSNVGTPNETFFYNKKKMLDEIIILDTANIGGIRTESFKFTYNKDKTVKSITHDDGVFTETVNFTYLNHYVKYMTYSINGEIRLTSNFFRDDEEAAKITKIIEIYDRSFFEENHLLKNATLFNKYVGDEEKIKELAASNTKSLTLRCTKVITYNGDNIVKIEENYPDLYKSIITEKTYSGILNPYYGLNYCYSNDLLGFSKNMADRKSVSTFYDGMLTDVTVTEYQYNDVNKDNYPKMFTYTSNKAPGVYIKTYINYVSEYK